LAPAPAAYSSRVGHYLGDSPSDHDFASADSAAYLSPRAMVIGLTSPLGPALLHSRAAAMRLRLRSYWFCELNVSAFCAVCEAMFSPLRPTRTIRPITTVASRTNNKAGCFTHLEPSLVSVVGFSNNPLGAMGNLHWRLTYNSPSSAFAHADIGIGPYKFEREAKAHL